MSEEERIVKQPHAPVARWSFTGEMLRSVIITRNGERLREDGSENGQRAKGVGLCSHSDSEPTLCPKRAR